MKEIPQLKTNIVPCGTCTLCCRNDAIRIMPYDDATLYKTEPHPAFKGAVMLAHKPDGACYYLGEGGCTIHDKRPAQCRTFDCRNLAKIPFTTARKNTNRIPMAVWRRGKELTALTNKGNKP